MDFEHSSESDRAAGNSCRPSWPEPRLSRRTSLSGAGRERPSPSPAADPGRAEAPRPRRGALEPVPARRSWRGDRQSRLRAAGRDHGTGVVGVRNLQLLGARHRQHGSAVAVRHGGTEEALARAAAGGRNPLGLLDDRARGRIQRRHQHPVQHPPRRRRLRHQRPQMVHLGRDERGLQDPDRDGQDRSRQSQQAPAAVDGAGAPGDAGRPHRARHARVRLRRRAGRPSRDRLRQCPGARRQHPARRRPRL